MGDYDDPEHDPKTMREIQKKRRNARVRAQCAADQAWANAREALSQLTRLKDKLSGQGTLMQEDKDLLALALKLVIGELYLRQAQNLESGY